MKLESLPSFRRCLRGFPDERLATVWRAMQVADAAYGQPHKHAGIGLRQIGGFMECRDALDYRLVFQRDSSSLVFHFYGTHDEVRAFLRNRR